MADALILSRGGIITSPFGVELDTQWKPDNIHELIDDTAPMARWEPLIRFNVCLLELISDVAFELLPQGAARPTGARLVHRSLKTNWVSTAIVQLDRPEDPQLFADQLDLVFNWARYREDRLNEIISQLVPQTPFWSAVANLQPTRRKYTYELIELTLAFASMAAMRFKQAFNCPRPVAHTAKIQPMVPTPEHSTFPSGHATEAYAVAHVLGCLIPGTNGAAIWSQLNALAGRIATNRTVAGVHFPMDSMAGRVLGATVGEYLAYMCSTTQIPGMARPNKAGAHAGWLERTFTTTGMSTKKDFLPSDDLTAEGQEHDPLKGVARKGVLKWMWDQAVLEWN
ncbi:phosphatase PAP2 family protein [Ramlibacter sp. G-1-2-2]|uniref:Phosphatase PAP2 family protein n=1 Tax=Ramlibacter agri TaxID=2728837 RepID=A0A848HA25_9BURK|nr:phosphatase PAP2 family protein [Ramlibacter agri]NML46300.1 phosphatase PAP2 family protein [Ramlibacter agri]